MNASDAALAPPRRLILQPIARVLMRLIGWNVDGDLPKAPRFVAVVYPHTSNWDVPVGLICGYALGVLELWPFRFMVKDSAVNWPLVGPLMRWLGGIAIDRSQANSLVDQMVEYLGTQERFLLAITPEGTRRYRPYWKSGFYHIALGADVPVVLAALDFGNRVVSISPAFKLSGDVEADLERIRRFFAGKQARHPEQAGDIRFKPAEPAA